MQATKKIFFLTATAMLLSPALSIAADTNPQDKSGNYNIMLISLVGFMLILLFVIGMLANTLRQLSFVVRDKKRKERREASGVVKTILLVVAMTVPAFHSFADEKANAVVAPASNYIQGIAVMDFYAITAFIILEIIIIFALVLNINTLLKSIRKTLEIEEKTVAVVQKSWFWDKFNNAASLEKEKDILLDHNYDGIQELDNSLPPWWKYGFYLTIIVGVIYLYRFHVSHDGPSQQEEFVAEMQKGEEDKAAYLAKAGNNVDESNVTLLTDATEVGAGKELFLKNCAPCHLPDGGGVVGPNLTDDYWLHGGSIKDVFKTIKYGWQDKGMKSWKDDFSAKQIQELASFVKSLRGTHPATPKAPQGDLYIESTQGGKASDSTKTDSTKAAKVAIK